MAFICGRVLRPVNALALRLASFSVLCGSTVFGGRHHYWRFRSLSPGPESQRVRRRAELVRVPLREPSDRVAVWPGARVHQLHGEHAPVSADGPPEHVYRCTSCFGHWPVRHGRGYHQVRRRFQARHDEDHELQERGYILRGARYGWGSQARCGAGGLRLLGRRDELLFREAQRLALRQRAEPKDTFRDAVDAVQRAPVLPPGGAAGGGDVQD
mmetsp:Transcript_40842/g.106359  ORF Transcript_40842/g.106359 Transcript_40842/m.106359 type:complete len:213 (-) Transcript_40842:262-900(-)